MKLKKTLFGGYKKNLVDNVIQQLTEKEELAQAKIVNLQNEFRLLKENTQRNIETIQSELVMRQKSLAELTKNIESKNERIFMLEEKSSAKIIEMETDFIKKTNEIETQYKTKLHDVEISYQVQLSEMESKYKEKARHADQNEEQLKKIGQIYVNAYEYTEKIKKEAKEKVIESMDQIFEELYHLQDQFESSFNPINQKKRNLKQLVMETEGMFQLLQNKMDRMDRDQASIVYPFQLLKETKEKINNRINKIYADEYHQDKAYQNDENSIKEPIHQHIEPVSTLSETIINPTLIDYAAQIEELRQKIEKQQELLSRSDNKVILTSEQKLQETHIDEQIDETDRVDVIAKDSTVPSQTEPETEIKKDGLSRYERERNEREKYSKYFVEIGKKYSKDQRISYPVEIQNTSSQDLENIDESPFTMNSYEIITPSNQNTTDSEEPISNDVVNKTEDMENATIKKPSIKDILNKYANIK